MCSEVVVVRPVEGEEELEQALQIALGEKWSVSRASFSNPFALSPATCLAAGSSSGPPPQLLGTAFGVPYDDSSRAAYVLNVLVVPAHRRRGLARRLVQELLERLRAAGVVSVGLDATSQGRHLYETLGFKRSFDLLTFDLDLAQYHPPCTEAVASTAVLEPFSPALLDAVTELDAACFGFRRSKLYQQYFGNPFKGFVLRSNGDKRLRGAICARATVGNSCVIGPLLADCDDTAYMLLGAIVRSCVAAGARFCIAFVPEWHMASVTLLTRFSFSQDPTLTHRMWLNLLDPSAEAVRRETSGYYIVAGPDIG